MSAIDHDFDLEDAVPLTLPDEDAGGARGARGTARGGWLARLSVAAKLNLAVFGNTIVLALIAVVMLAGTWQLAQGGERQAILASVEVRTNNAAIALVAATDGLDAAAAGDAEGLAKARDSLRTAHDALKDPVDFAGDRMPADLVPVMQGFLATVDDLRSDADRLTANQREIAALRAETQAAYADISGFAVQFHDRAAQGADELFAAITRFLLTFVVLTVVGIAISLLGARRIIGDVTGMITAITGSMQRIAAGKTDSEIPGRERQDEIGAMARALGVFRQSSLELRDLNQTRARDAEAQLARQRELSEQMRAMRLEKSQLLDNMASGFEVSVGELITAVSAASEQLKATSRQMVDLAEDSSEQADSASAAMEEATANVTAAAAATDEFALSISEISRQASASAQLARGASELVTTANTKMSDLSQAAVEIGEIAGLIQTIAQRTNLLALNASIEAARGGEAGRGFAVVASEVKELAMQTSNATSSVTEKITAMQESTRSSASDLSGIVTRISELEQAAVMIASAVDQQSVSGEELARNIDTVAAGSAQVGKRLEALRGASEETGTAADDVVASANALGAHAEELRAKAGRFIADVRLSARELEAGGVEL
ncbi:chemotaxis protein [Erythrobacter sp. Dej080120_24]|uniref:methyl-accepting chemotaxis protein n=1 Tax=Erythrobacter sp. Dej080120_24 TaxID=3024837 RepID=UPI0004D88ADA|nr:hypothetical protein EH30_10530 [Erythrobacter sp. JL475]BDW83487.1 chemotaxis protein [Erythrobacter sp. Dej080120_24]